MSATEPETPEARFIKAAIAHHALLKAGSVEASNKAHDALIDAAGALRKQADQGKAFFSDMLANADDSVGLWSAYFLLPLDEASALSKLRTLATNAEWPLCSTAETTMDQWREGTLDVDWFMQED